MPRGFDSDEAQPALRFYENVECRQCGLVFEGSFLDLTGSMTFQDMTDPPVGLHDCPGCGHEWASEATGWSFFSEAG